MSGKSILSLSEFPAFIDHTLLKPEATEREIVALCQEAAEFHFGAVCVNPCDVVLAAESLRGTKIGIVSVVSFPLGKCRTETKVIEALSAVDDGATEIDMVANRGLLVDNRLSEYEADIRKVRRNLPPEVILKVILEVGALSPLQIEQAVEMSVNAGAEFVKSSTGFFGGCTLEQIETLVRLAGGRIKVKASGGIRTLEACQKLITAGADRIGTSAGVSIFRELQSAK